MRRLKILHVTPSLVPYGAEKTVGLLALGTNRERFDVSVISLFGEEKASLAPALRLGGIPVYHLNKHRGPDVRMFSRLARLFKQVRPDVVHTSNYVLRYTWLAATRNQVPVQVHTLQNLAEKEMGNVALKMQRWAFQRGVCPVSIAERVSDSFERTYRLPRPALIPNAIEVDLFSDAKQMRAEWRQREGFAPDDLLYVCAARFFDQKNHRMLLDAFAAGPAKIPACKLLLAGDGELRGELEQQAERLRIRDRVFFLGRRQDVRDLLGAADVFALSSIYEGNPLSVMEAMAAGLPVVATSVGGIPELIESGRNGLLVNSGDTQSFADALMMFANDPAALRRMGDAAARRAREKFDQSLMIRAYEDLYTGLLSAKDTKSQAKEERIPELSRR